jgi:hypothetical protein
MTLVEVDTMRASSVKCDQELHFDATVPRRLVQLEMSLAGCAPFDCSNLDHAANIQILSTLFTQLTAEMSQPDSALTKEEYEAVFS